MKGSSKKRTTIVISIVSLIILFLLGVTVLNVIAVLTNHQVTHYKNYEDFLEKAPLKTDLFPKQLEEDAGKIKYYTYWNFLGMPSFAGVRFKLTEEQRVSFTQGEELLPHTVEGVAYWEEACEKLAGVKDLEENYVLVHYKAKGVGVGPRIEGILLNEDAGEVIIFCYTSR